MGTQVTGRKRIPNREKMAAEDDALGQIAREAEARLAAKRAARAEAREIRMRELERQQKEIDQAHKEESERYSRHSRKNTSISDDEERMSVGSRGSLRPSDYSGFLGSSSRASSRASSARASPVVEERPDRDFLEKGSRTASTLSAATLASLGGASSRRGSCATSISGDTEASIREMKDSLVEVEEKYRRAMVSNAQLDNEKSNLMYQVDTLKDTLLELEEQLCELRREYEDKSKELDRERHAHTILQFQFVEVKETLKQSEDVLMDARQLRLKQDGYVREISDLQETLEWREKKIAALERQKQFSDSVQDERKDLTDEVLRLRDVIKKHGIVLGSEVTTNGEAGEGVMDGPISTETATRSAQEPHSLSDGLLEIRLRKLVDERENLVDQVRKLRAQLEQKQKNGKEEDTSPDEDTLQNGTDPHIIDLQRDSNRQISDLKFKLVKSEQEVAALEQNILRLEGQVTRYKSAMENAEKVEDELKVEKRKLQRELRSALDRTDELEASNSHLSKRLEKMKANRSALLAQQ
ncbi:leucine-rich repeat flightless-interacting protein 2 isoform X12 [Denticeps clupeoides]|uniref:Leucine-rich repeat flightless-interacting protein 1 n=1 Tax=Denticeps clupeoides TaxID=299321 RepID=A0AAY4E255_9TELE|nr:leucine-rich repeat flightless-interacting protein 1 isoform X12 [Denticeps clupeoides]